MRGLNIRAKKKVQKTKGNRVSISSEGVRLPLAKDEIKRLASKTLYLMGEGDSKVDLVFVDDKRMRKLNWKYRRINRTTDCLAFSMREGEDSQLHPELLGDVVISVDSAKRNAKLFGSNIKEEMAIYIIHGMLHLLGFNDTTTAGRKKMVSKEKDILRRL